MSFLSTITLKSNPLLILTRLKATFVRKSPNDHVIYKWTQDWRVAKTRCYFPRPSEVTRIRKHGWDARMSTEGGRKVLMNRILKGRHVLSH